MNYLVQGQDVIFNLAGQVSHIDSMRDPHTDLEVNCRAQLTLARGVPPPQPRRQGGLRRHAPGLRPARRLPVTEEHLVRPTDVNGINKVAGEYYHLVYNNVFGVRACSLRLTNVYGPRQLIRHNRQGFIGWFIRLALDRQRDPDLRRRLADPRLRLRRRRRRRVPARRRDRRRQRRGLQRRRRRALDPRRPGGAAGLAVASGGSFRFVEWPPEKKVIDIGSFYADSSKFHAATGWAPGVRLREGLATTLAYYREHYADYVVPEARRLDRRGREATSCHARFACPSTCCAPATIAPRSTRPSRASSIAAGSCSAPRSRRSRPSSPLPSAPRTPSASNTGTDAIALALRALGIGPGDEVITSPLSAAYSALAIDMTGARPVFADVDPARLTLDPAAVAAAVTPRTRAVLPVHLYGQPADMDGIARVAARHGLAVVEDACQAHLATRRRAAGRPRFGGGRATASIRPRTSARSATAAPSSTDDARAGRAASVACATAASRAAITTTSAA